MPARSPPSSSASSPRSAAASCATCSPARCPRCCAASCTPCPPCSGRPDRRRRRRTSAPSPHCGALGRRRSGLRAPDAGRRASTSTPRSPCEPETPREHAPRREPREAERPPRARTTPSSCCPSAARRSPTTSAVPAHVSRPGAASRTSGSRRSAEHYHALRRPQPDQRPEPRPPRRPARRARPPRIDPPSLGQPQLGRLPRPTPCARRTRPAYAGCVAVVDQRLLVATPPAGSTARTSPTRGRRRGREGVELADRQGPALLQPPGLRRAPTPAGHRGRCAALGGGAGRASSRLVFVTHSIPTAMDDTSGPGDGEGNLYRRQHLRARARRHRRGQRDARAATSTGELVFCSRSGPPPSRGSSPTSTTTSRSWRAEGVRPSWSWRRSASSPTTWRSSTTSTPRPRRPPSELGLQLRPGADRRHRRRVRRAAWSTSCSSARPRPAARSRPSPVVAGPRPCRRCAARLLPQPARGRAGPVRAGLSVDPPTVPRRRDELRPSSSSSPSRSPTEAGAAHPSTSGRAELGRRRDQVAAPPTSSPSWTSAPRSCCARGCIRGPPRRRHPRRGGRRRAPARSGVTWVVDPIDGTVNYLYDIPRMPCPSPPSSATRRPGRWRRWPGRSSTR